MSADIEDDDALPAPLGVAQIEAFWRAFAAREAELAALPPQEFVEQATALLEQHAPGLGLELEQGADGALPLLVVTAHGSLDGFENVQALVRHAPPQSHWRLQAFRSRALGSDFSMGMDGFSLACSDVLVAHYDAGGTVGLELSFEKIIPQDMVEHARHMSFIMLDHVLGEWDFAVRVGPVEFVDAFSDDVEGAEPLSVFPAIFDAFVREQLGRSYEFPPADDDSWTVFEVRRHDAADDAPPDLLTFRASANAVATRADLPYFLEWRLPFDSQQQLDQVRDAHEALQAELERLHGGLLAFTRIEQMDTRVAGYYVEDAVAATELAHQLAARHAPGLDEDVSTMFDPAWQEYLALYSAVRPGVRAGEESA
ncbi:MAG: hypothetical protein ACN6O3_10095 [Comamonas sp.]